jgi:hypothetical protein
MDFSPKNNVTTLEHLPPPSTLLTRLQLIFVCSLQKCRRFCDANDLIKNATKELKRLSQNGFQDVSNTFTVAGRSVYMDNILKEMKLK